MPTKTRHHSVPMGNGVTQSMLNQPRDMKSVTGDDQCLSAGVSPSALPFRQ
jgi:hypothetical protein